MARPRRKRNQSKPTDDGSEQLPMSDEDTEERQIKPQDKKLVARDGQLGFSHNKRGFDSRTNFTLEIIGDIHSVDYQIRGRS